MDTKVLRNPFAKDKKAPTSSETSKFFKKAHYFILLDYHIVFNKNGAAEAFRIFQSEDFFSLRASRMFWFLLDERKCTSLTYQARILTFCSEAPTYESNQTQKSSRSFQIKSEFLFSWKWAVEEWKRIISNQWNSASGGSCETMFRKVVLKGIFPWKNQSVF